MATGTFCLSFGYRIGLIALALYHCVFKTALITWESIFLPMIEKVMLIINVLRRFDKCLASKYMVMSLIQVDTIP